MFQKMSKTAYALGFMALCGVILVIHEQTNTENIKSDVYSEDPFLASVEKVHTQSSPIACTNQK